MKRLPLLLIVVVLMLAACGQDKANDDTQPAATTPPTSPSSGFNFGIEPQVIEVPTQTLGVGDGVLTVNVTMPDGYKFNTLAPFKAAISTSAETVQVDAAWVAYQQIAPTMPLQIPLTLAAGEAVINAHLEIYWCEAVNETLCFVDSRDVQIPVVVAAESDQTQLEAVVALVPPTQ